jgi:hypothetical protein
VIAVLEAAAATQGDEPRIPDLGEDHQFAISLFEGPSDTRLTVEARRTVPGAELLESTPAPALKAWLTYVDPESIG